MTDKSKSANPQTARGKSASGWNRFFGAAEKPPVSQIDNSQLAEMARAFEESGRGWFWSTDGELRLTYVSDCVGRTLGQEAGNLIGQPLESLFRQERRADTANSRTLPFVLRTKSKFSNLELLAACDSAECWWSVNGRPEFDKAGNLLGYKGSGLDVTRNRQSHDEASRLSESDTLTGLASRHRISQRLEAALTAYKVAKRSCALMIIDLDRFKQINDTLGHQAGDEVLKQASQRLMRVVAPDWEVGRLGGDEFQVIMPDIDDRGQLGDAARKIISMISQPYTVDGVRCVIGASVGMAVAPFDGITSEELTRSADLALYAAKNDGRGRYRFYSSDLHDKAEDRRQLEDDLRDALDRGELSLMYQPVVDAGSNLISGFEALMRWDHPEKGPISPAIFIPIAEDANIISKLGEWALRQACDDASKWAGNARVAVNVSPIQFANTELAALVASALSNSGLAPERLELEITESVFLGENADTDNVFATLKKVGVRLALDDFGTGYSSLGYLKTAPFDKIKIDQSFVRGATESGNRNAAIITAIVSLAQALDMETTAEGIETLDTLDLIRKLNVSHVQGYVYSRPLSNHEISERLARGDLHIMPTGHDVHRYDRKTLFRMIGVIHEDHRYDVMMRNLSKSGIRIEGLVDVPVGTEFVIDFGEGQLAVATVKRSHETSQGLQFEIPLISDGSDGLCTRHRVSPYVLAAAGMPLAALPSGNYPLVGNEPIGSGKPKSLPRFSQVDRSDVLLRVA